MEAMARPTDPAPEGDDAIDADLDAEALSWAGDEEQGRARPRLAASVDADAVEAAADDEPDDADLEARAPRDVAGGAVAVLGGILYLALTVGWVYSVQLSVTAAPSQDFPGPIVWQFGKFLAMIGAPLWFGAVIVLTRGRVGLRLGWFALGLGLLLPWPVVLELAG
jgi:hypothetical protein